jgi:hypothetical protein
MEPTPPVTWRTDGVVSHAAVARQSIALISPSNDSASRLNTCVIDTLLADG